MAQPRKTTISPGPLTTPGPWVVYFCDDKPHSILPAMRGGEICNFDHSNGTLEDARLIAAAPELRDVAELLLLFYAAPHWDDPQRARWEELSGSTEATTKVLADSARAALAKAEYRDDDDEYEYEDED